MGVKYTLIDECGFGDGHRRRLFDPLLNYIFCAMTNDRGGCGHYRSIFITQGIQQLHENCFFVQLDSLSLHDPDILCECSSFRVQRLCSDKELNWYVNYLLPARRQFGFRVLYDTDDILLGEDFPACNLWRERFFGLADNLKTAMQGADLVTVTTPQLRDYYARRLNIPASHFLVIPNYPPQAWADYYRPGEATQRFHRHRGRLRVGFCASPSHFSVKEGEEVRDDLSQLADWIIANRKRYQFVFQGGISNYLEPYRDDFEVHPYVRFLHYPRERQKLDLDLWICPLEDNEFNRCKSEIKLYEAWAGGIPVLVQRLPNYEALAPEACFSTAEELAAKVVQMTDSAESLEKIVADNYARMQGRWLEDHLEEWFKIML